MTSLQENITPNNYLLSIIIPCFNEAENISKLINHIKKSVGTSISFEIIVVDGGSADETVRLAQQEKDTVVLSSTKGRAAQMNEGAKIARGNVLYFLHADTIPPQSFAQDILAAVSSNKPIGSYRLKIASNNLFLQFNSYCSRFNRMWLRGGDQSLFITKTLFDDLKGYNPFFTVMEEYDLIQRAKRKTSFTILEKSIIASARKYEENTYLRVNIANFLAYVMFVLKFHPGTIKRIYKKQLKTSNY